MKLKSILLETGRWIIVLTAVVYLAVLLGGNTVSNADFSQVEQAVVDTVDMTNLQQAENRMVKRLYGLDPGDYEACVLYYPATNMDAEELLLIKLSDTGQQDGVVAAVEQRLQTQRDAFEGYGVEQFDLLTNHYVLQVQGNYALFAVGKFHQDALAAFRDAL